MGVVTYAERDREFKEAVKAYRLGRLDDAVERFRSLADRRIPEPLHLSYLGLLKVVWERQAREGLELCQRAVVLDHQHPQVFLNLARAYSALRRNGRAAGVLRDGLRAWPRDSSLQLEIQQLSPRRREPLPYLDRDHVLNKYLGKLRARLSGSRV